MYSQSGNEPCSVGRHFHTRFDSPGLWRRLRHLPPYAQCFDCIVSDILMIDSGKAG